MFKAITSPTPTISRLPVGTTFMRSNSPSVYVKTGEHAAIELTEGCKIHPVVYMNHKEALLPVVYGDKVAAT